MSELQNVFASIASAIRAKNDKSEAFTPAQMIDEIYELDKIMSAETYKNNSSISSFYDSTYTYLLDNAFYNCSNLRSVGFEKVKYVGANCFYKDTLLNTISFPKLEKIGNFAFYAAKLSSDSITFPKCELVGENAFAYYYESYYQAPGLSEVYLPECKNINASAFFGRSVDSYDMYTFNLSLKKVYAPKCEYIYNNAFAHNEGLSDFYAPELKFVGESAFCNTRLSSFHFNKLEYLGDYAFCNNNFDFISLPNIISYTNVGAFAFSGCKNLSSFYCPYFFSVSIPNYTFQFTGISGILSLDTEYLGYGTFRGCSKITELYLPYCKNIPSSCFQSASSLSIISAPNINGVGSFGFQNIGSADLEFPKITTLWSGAFQYAKITRISASLLRDLVNGTQFYNCYNLQSVYFPLISSITFSCFYMCSSLSDVYIPNCSSIGQYAFYSCGNLSTLSIPKCNNIFSNAFNRCTNLMSLYLLSNSIASLANINAFNSTPLSAGGSGTIYVPSSLYSNYISANNWSLISARISSYIE